MQSGEYLSSRKLRAVSKDEDIHASALTVRKLEIDLHAGFGRHWCGGDAFLTQFHNALSMSFPVGEQSFIDSVRACAERLPPTPEQAAIRENVAQFIGQEATHRHIHALYNRHLKHLGLHNRWEHWATKRLALARRHEIDALHLLAVTAAFEHLTAMLSDYVFRYDTSLQSAEPTMRTLWRWHAAEETEHRAVAFNLYNALNGSYGWRVRWYLHALMVFGWDAARQTVLNLWHDGTLFKPATWCSAARFILGSNGLLRRCGSAAIAYLRRDFHPNRETGGTAQISTMAMAQQWLTDNAESYRVVR